MHTEHIPQALAEAVAADGFEAHVAAVTELVTEARRHGVCELLADVALDEHQPTVVRERAFGRLVVAFHKTLAADVDADRMVAEPLTTSERFTVAA
jgi:hypothetical protein